MNFELDAPVPLPVDSPSGARVEARDGRVEAIVRTIVRRKKTSARMGLRDETAVVLVIDGVKQASQVAGVSGRTLRRHFVREGSTLSAFVTEVRLEAARELYALGWTTGRASSALGYSSAAAYRRFLRKSSGLGVLRLRKAPVSSRSQSGREAGRETPAGPPFNREGAFPCSPQATGRRSEASG